MIYLTQLLCPQRHCVLAAVWDESDNTAREVESQLREQFREAVQTRQINPYCGLCRSETLHCEHGRTPWATLREALPHIQAAEREQLLIAAAAASHT